MTRILPLAALAAAATALSACSTVGNAASAVWPFGRDSNDSQAAAAPQDGRISILTFEQQLAPDPALA
ncbi:MAG: dehydrogenase, partial [Hyphomonadaceae bacterium]